MRLRKNNNIQNRALLLSLTVFVKIHMNPEDAKTHPCLLYLIFYANLSVAMKDCDTNRFI